MKKNLFFVFLISIFMFVSVGLSAFILDGAQSFFDYEINNLNDYTVTLDYNDGHSSDYIYHLDNKSGVIDFSNVPTPINEKNHTFVGWYKTKTGFFEDGTSSKYNGEVITSNTKLYAKYVNNETSVLDKYMTGSISVLPSMLNTQSYRYYISSFTSTNEISSSMNIKTGGKISLNYAESGGEYTDSTLGTDANYKYISKSKIIGTLDSNLIIDGGEFKVNSVLGGNTGNTMQALISTTEYTALDLNGYNLVIRNGGKLSGYSIIYNSKDTGGIICENGTIYTPFLVYGYRGGSGTGFYWANAIASFDQFLCPYLSAETIFTKYSKLIGQTSLYTGKTAITSARENITTMNLISNSSTSLIQINEGYLIRRQTPYQDIFESDSLFYEDNNFNFYNYLDTSYREQLIFTNSCKASVNSIDYDMLDAYITNRCDISLNSLELKVDVGISLNASMKYVDFPIPSFMDIYMYNTDLRFAFSIMFMPGSSLYTDENSVIYMKYDTSGSYTLFAKIMAYTSMPYTAKYKVGGGYYGYPDKSSPLLFYSDALFDCRKKAILNINGNIIFDTSCTVDYSSYYKFYSIGGYINLSSKALNSIMNNYTIVKLQTMIGYYHFSSEKKTIGSEYYMDLTYYNSVPLICDGKAYIQLTDGGNVIKCNSYDDNNLIFKSNNKYYFFKTNNNNKANLTTATTTGLTSYTSKPADLKIKYSNYYGNYQECTQTILNINNVNMSYITSNGINYALVSGIYVPLASAPTYDASTNVVSDVTLSSSNKFSGTNGSTVSYGTSIYFDYQYLNCWRLNYSA